MGSRFARSIRNFDTQGDSVGMNFKGESTYKTTYGGCVTLLTYLLFFLYFIQKGEEMVLRSNPNTSYNPQAISSQEFGNKTANEAHFNVALYFMNDGVHWELDDKLFNVEIGMISQ